LSPVSIPKPSLDQNLTAEENIRFHVALYNLYTYRPTYASMPQAYKNQVKELTTVLGLTDQDMSQPVDKLSGGMKRKLEIVRSLMHRPKILFLDEPTIGLDLVAQQKMRDFIYEYNRKYQATIILTSHNMDDLVDLARRVIVVDEGKILFDGALEELVEKFAKEKIIKATLAKSDGIVDLEKIGKVRKLAFPEVVISVPRNAIAVAAAELLQNFAVDDLTIEEIPIEDVIRKVFKGGIFGK